MNYKVKIHDILKTTKAGIVGYSNEHFDINMKISLDIGYTVVLNRIDNKKMYQITRTLAWDYIKKRTFIKEWNMGKNLLSIVNKNDSYREAYREGREYKKPLNQAFVLLHTLYSSKTIQCIALKTITEQVINW